MLYQVRDTFHQVPFDEPGVDGDDSIPIYSRSPDRVLSGVQTLEEVERYLVVKFVFSQRGDQGDHIYALKRATYRILGQLPWLMAQPPSSRRAWGPVFSQHYKQAQQKVRLSPRLTYTAEVHTRFAPFYDAFALSLLHDTARDRKVALQLGWHNELYNRRGQVAYSQARPSQLRKAKDITRADCSGSVAGGCAWAKILPRVDWRYTNTWVQIALGKPVANIKAALPGDVVLYGSSTSNPTHEALYLGGGRVWSFGSYPVKILPVDYRHDRVAIRRFLPT